MRHIAALSLLGLTVAVGRGGKPRGGRSGSHKGHSVTLDPFLLLILLEEALTVNPSAHPMLADGT